MNSSGKFAGFTQFSETWNGRLAMMGLVIALAEELITGQGFLHALHLL
ncbi:MAG: chlorophyll A-B binding protein [Thermosynechococcaceae cyanobacterium]